MASDDPMPSCVITLYFLKGDRAEAVPPQFLYFCTNSSQGWHVQTNGSIHPPLRKRVVQIRLNDFEDDPENPLRLSGFQMVAPGQKWPLKDDSGLNWTSRKALKALGVKIVSPRQYPPKASGRVGLMTFDFTGATKRQILYRLAVSAGDSEPIWDDPKIYDDGSE